MKKRLNTPACALILRAIMILVTAPVLSCGDGMDILLQDRNEFMATIGALWQSADLRDLSLSTGSLTPGFASDTTLYASCIIVESAPHTEQVYGTNFNTPVQNFFSLPELCRCAIITADKRLCVA